ncbi:NADH dehydrogenase [ubiquinone] 1 alpha subcomplex assembly factor 2-like [Rhinopithecus roxellana]|uniref:NADH dehydrogenase [ubiquinone] 1 alpha subcomplex assembly factor 2-like n=1 Tax=Rhinopithecus roxellana TaxID=61622 RepID=UPI001237249C|nr:NADH dehydrogenase [ubiquinone] 1 alpha subcomplex assembly factor 2-like [Rhinopithecus roxellana]
MRFCFRWTRKPLLISCSISLVKGAKTMVENMEALEIVKNEKCREEVKIKSQDFCEKEKLLSKETNEELLPPPVQTQIKGHASAPYFGKEEPSVTPSSTGKTFQPGSWMPQDGKSHSQ